MGKIHINQSTKISPTKLPAAMFSAIGRLIRAFADIEDSLNLYINNLARTKEAAAFILMGRSPISAKINMAKSLASLHRAELVELTETLFFSQDFKEANGCRNTTAHGVLLGQWGKPKHYAFLTSTALEPVDFHMRREVVSYRLLDVQNYAKFAEGWAKHISEVLELAALRETRFQQSLLPHRKSQPRRNGKG